MIQQFYIARLGAWVIHNAYLPLMGLAAATVITGTALSQRITALNADYLRQAKQWTQRTNDYVSLRGLAGAVKTAIDEQQSVKAVDAAARVKTEKAIAALDAKLQPLLDDLEADPGRFEHELLPDVAKFVQAARGLNKDAASGAADKVTDKDLKDLNAAITVVTTKVRAEVGAEGDTTLSAAERIEAWQKGVAVGTVPVMIVLGLAGWGVSRRLSRTTAAAQASRKSAEDNLREVEALRSTVDRQSLVSVADTSGRIIDVNDLFCRVYGYSRQELVGQNHRMLNSGVHPGAFWQALLRTIADGDAWRGDVCNKARDGSLHWADTIIAPFKGADGNVEKYVAIRTDITARKRAAAELETSQRRAHLVHRAGAVANRTNDVREIIAHCLEVISKETGWPIGHAYMAGPDDELTSSGLWHISEQASGGGTAATGEAPGAAYAEFKAASEACRFAPGIGMPGRVFQSGESLWIRDVHADANFPRAAVCESVNLHGAFAFPVPVSGRVEAVLEFFQPSPAEPDAGLLLLVQTLGREIGGVIERQRAEAAVRASERRMRTIIDAEPECVKILGPGDTLLELNRSGLEMFEVESVERVRELTLAHFVLPEYQESLSRMHAGVLRGTPGTCVFEMRGFKGTRRWMDAHAVPLRSSAGEVEAVLAVTRDITAVKHAEAQLQATNEQLLRARAELEERVTQRTAQLAEAKEAAEHASRVKSEFLAHMSHEIRTPLNGAMGMVDLLLESGLTEQQRRFGRLAKASAESLRTVINDILDFSKIEAGKLELLIEDFDLHRSIREITELMAHKGSKKGLSVVASIDPAVPERARADGERLRQILMNLVNNAVKFTERGEVLIRVVPDSRTDGRPGLRFTVKDTGVGIPRDRLDRLFKAFSQADASTTRVFGGTGLGLVISKQLVELMGGAIGVQSEPGQGSTFWFTIAYEPSTHAGAGADTEQFDPAQRAPAIRATPGKRILLAEDNEINQIVAGEILARAGYRYEVVADGRAAVDVLKRGRFDMVLMDCQMPVMDGFDATREIRRLEQEGVLPGGGQRMPIVALTANAMKGDRERCLEAGMDAFTTKPINPKILLHAIESALRGELTAAPEQ